MERLDEGWQCSKTERAEPRDLAAWEGSGQIARVNENLGNVFLPGHCLRVLPAAAASWHSVREDVWHCCTVPSRSIAADLQTLPVHDAKGHTYMPTFYACTNPATLPSAQTQNSQEQQQQHQQQQPQQHFQQGWWHVVTCYSHPDETERSTELVNASALSTAAAEPSACTMVERRPERAVSRSCGICSSARRNLPHCTCLKPYLVRPCSGCAYHLWPGCRPLINLGQLVRQVPYKHNRTRRLLGMVRKDRWVVQ